MPALDTAAAEAAKLDRLAAAFIAMGPAERQRFVATLGADRVRTLEQAMGRAQQLGWRADPASMAHHLDPSFTVHPYVRLLSAKFRDAVEGRSRRQIWNLQARLGKSLLASQWGPLWALDLNPEARFILWSFGKSLAVENAVGIRDRAQLYAAELHVSLRQDRRRMDRFVTTEGGGVLAAGVRSLVRGFGAGHGGGIICDDPFKDWQEAHSEARRDFVWNQYRGTLLDRLDDESAFIIHVHHRVHEDDMTGRLLADADIGGVQWEHVVLPALAVDHDVLGRQPGEPLVPERFSVGFLTEQARAMGSYLASALLQQNPTPEEGTELLRAWFRLYEQPPAAPDQALTSWDLKLKDKEAGDFVVGQAWWRTGPDYWLRDQLRGQWDHATTGNAIALLAVRHPECRAHVIEAAGSADSVVPELRKPQADYVVTAEMAGRLGMNETERLAVQVLRRRGLSGLVAEPVTDGKKQVRARLFIAPAAEAGNVHLPAYAEWVPHLLDEIASFPNGNHDDQVDAMSQAMKRMGTGVATVSAAKGRLGPRGPRAGVAGPAPAKTPTGGARPAGQPGAPPARASSAARRRLR